MTISFIRSLYDEGSPFIQDESYYEDLMPKLWDEMLPLQTYYLLKKQHTFNKVPLFFQVKLQKRVDRLVREMVPIKYETDQLLKSFEERKIEIIPLKGIIFAEQYFEQFASRYTSDIDLLIKPTNYEQAAILLKELGFTCIKSIPNHYHGNFIKKMPNGKQIDVELHWSIHDEKTTNINMNVFWNEAQPYKEYTYIKTFSSYHTFYSILLHGWSHQLNHLKYFVDIIQLIHVLRDKIDYERLLQDAKRDKTYNRIRSTLGIVYHLFPHLHQIKPLPMKIGKSTKWWSEDFLAGNNASNVQSYIKWARNVFYHDVLDCDSFQDKARMCKQWFIPSNRFLKFKGMKGNKASNYFIFYRNIVKKTINVLLYKK